MGVRSPSREGCGSPTRASRSQALGHGFCEGFSSDQHHGTFSLFESPWPLLHTSQVCLEEIAKSYQSVPGLSLGNAKPPGAGRPAAQRLPAGSASPPYPAVGTDLPVRFDLALALLALLDELVKLLMELQE
jgi:hypothetical protein